MGFFSNTRRRNNQLDELNGMFGGPDVSWQTAPPPAATKRGGGFFGRGGVGRNIAGYIGDALAQMGGIQPVYAPAMEQQQRLSLYQQQREQQMQDYLFQQKYERENQGPDAFTASMMRGGIDPASPEGQALYRRHALNQAGGRMQAVPVQPGGSVAIVDPYTGQEVGAGGGASTPQMAPPQIGEVRRGYRFRGGDPASPDSWEPVQGGAAPSNGPRRFR